MCGGIYTERRPRSLRTDPGRSADLVPPGLLQAAGMASPVTTRGAPAVDRPPTKRSPPASAQGQWKLGSSALESGQMCVEAAEMEAWRDAASFFTSMPAVYRMTVPRSAVSGDAGL